LEGQLIIFSRLEQSLLILAIKIKQFTKLPQRITKHTVNMGLNLLTRLLSVAGNSRRLLNKIRTTPNFTNLVISAGSYSSIKLSDVELTSKRYKNHVHKDTNHGQLKADDVTYFRDYLGESRVVTDASDLEGHNVDWLRMVRG